MKAANGDVCGAVPSGRAVLVLWFGDSTGFAPVIEHTIGKISTWNAFCINALPMKIAVLNATNTMSWTYGGDVLNGVSPMLNSAKSSSYELRFRTGHFIGKYTLVGAVPRKEAAHVQVCETREQKLHDHQKRSQSQF